MVGGDFTAFFRVSSVNEARANAPTAVVCPALMLRSMNLLLGEVVFCSSHVCVPSWRNQQFFECTCLFCGGKARLGNQPQRRRRRSNSYRQTEK